jgi:hypothetical protein
VCKLPLQQKHSNSSEQGSEWQDALWGSGSGGRISWDRNSTFSGGRIFDHEIEIQFVHEIEFFWIIEQEIELALGALRELG